MTQNIYMHLAFKFPTDTYLTHCFCNTLLMAASTKPSYPSQISEEFVILFLWANKAYRRRILYVIAPLDAGEGEINDTFVLLTSCPGIICTNLLYQ